MSKDLVFYQDLLSDIKNRIRQGQYKAHISANSEMLATYWDIGKMIHLRQQQEGWGKGVIPRLAVDLKNELADVKGFSARNLKLMVQFYNEYNQLYPIGQQPVAQLTKASILQQSVAKLENDIISPLAVDKSKTAIGQQPVAQLENTENKQYIITHVGWSQHIFLIQKVKDLSTRFWYMQQILNNGWGRDRLEDMIKSNLHKRQGAIVNNFDQTLPNLNSELAKLLFKDPYIFDFMTLAAPFTEREIELELVKNVEKFLVELGAGFAFVGRQYKLEISEREFYLDLLFYHLKMRCFIVIELKKGEFMPEYAGKMNFYCSAVDDLLKHSTDQPTIGLILCQGKDRIFAEYSLRDIHKPIGISEYELTRALPDNFKGSLPSVEEIENELSFNKSTKKV
jgi:predicted nuclease of restriction endonuclease-like (RecB) superfamily